MLAIERETRPELTIETLIDEIATNKNFRQSTLPQPEEWQVKEVTSTYHAYSPMPVKSLDGVDMRFEVTVITDAFPPGICMGPQELRCYNIGAQEPTREARIDKLASLVVSSVDPHAALVRLRGLIDSGSGVSILTLSAYNRLAVYTGTILRPYGFIWCQWQGNHNFWTSRKRQIPVGKIRTGNQLCSRRRCNGCRRLPIGWEFPSSIPSLG